MLTSRRVWTLAACLLAVAPACVRADATGQLAHYVAIPDTSYTWRESDRSALAKPNSPELILTSQTWRGIPWKHQLIIIRPKSLEPGATQAFLFIHGGRWKPEYETGQAKLPPEARMFAKLAETLRAPVAVLRHVPFQPLFDRREDALIAYTFDQYLDTGEPDWPLLLPMVKSAARAMDTVQAFSRDRWQHPIDAFTVTGASKRGWTSWLTAAVDPRVASIAPIAIDMLNVPAQIKLQQATFGALSEQVQDYANIDLPGRVNTERGQSLMAMVDPYRYRADLTQPKLILLGTNDKYWPLDALKVYWDELSEPKRVLYVPNQGHGVRDFARLVGGLSALHRYSSHGEGLPAGVLDVRRWAGSSWRRRAVEPRATESGRVDGAQPYPGLSRGALDLASLHAQGREIRLQRRAASRGLRGRLCRALVQGFRIPEVPARHRGLHRGAGNGESPDC
jgi:PhoPQ-activated pathogenicity-related protein